MDGPVELRGQDRKRLPLSCVPASHGKGLEASNRQLGVPEFGSIPASGPLWPGVDDQRSLLQLQPDPLGGAANESRYDVWTQGKTFVIESSRTGSRR